MNPVCGCTGGCSNGCSNGCGSNCSSCRCCDSVFGFFTQVGALDVNAGGMIPFNGGSTVEGIWKDGGELTLDSAGVYMVTLSGAIPSNVTLYTELDVRVNGVSTPGGTLVLDKDSTGSPLLANTQTVITVSEGAVVTVTSSEAISLSADNDSDPIVTLSIVKIS